MAQRVLYRRGISIEQSCSEIFFLAIENADRTLIFLRFCISRAFHLYYTFCLVITNMAAFARSVPPLLRTSRLTLRQRHGVNPVQQALCGSRNGAQILYRGMATVFERNKPHVNIGMRTSHYFHVGLAMLNARSRYHWPRRSRKGKFKPPGKLGVGG